MLTKTELKQTIIECGWEVNDITELNGNYIVTVDNKNIVTVSVGMPLLQVKIHILSHQIEVMETKLINKDHYIASLKRDLDVSLGKQDRYRPPTIH